uniref:Uncharacterized protein n=1 Tax=Utricularia reniformis TaxID=192314 RepID=A0A1Y0B3H0_9LAMI|nr:hypothetical protein AEK19_MT1758 [Utricularia reniformis]ART31934.1 hypothetical protein AEK19_MT1758 [Utricularia reniformis]
MKDTRLGLLTNHWLTQYSFIEYPPLEKKRENQPFKLSIPVD